MAVESFCGEKLPSVCMRKVPPLASAGGEQVAACHFADWVDEAPAPRERERESV
jgi:hypothetical protein